MDKEGNVLGSCAKLYNNRDGFEEFINLIEGLKAKHHLRMFHRMEPTDIPGGSWPILQKIMTMSAVCADYGIEAS